MGDVKSLATKGIEIYHASSCLVFALTPTRTIFITPSTTSEILATQRNSQAPYRKLRKEILQGEYKDICDLLTGMRLKPGDGISYRQLYKWEIERITND